MSQHVADYPLGGQIEGALRRGARVGVIAAADLATNAATAKANVDTRTAGLHVSEQMHKNSVKESIDMLDNVLGSGLVSGGSLTNVYAAQEGTWDDCSPSGN